MSKYILYLGGFELPDKNAAAQRVMANAKLLCEIGFQVSFMGISKDIKNAPSNVDDFVSTPIPYPTGTKQWIHQITTFVDAEEILRRKPDYVILYNFPSIASLRILKACHKHGIKVIHDLTEWEIAEGWSPRSIIRKLDINLRMRYCMKKMDGVICISRYLYNYYSRYTNCILVPPTVDLDNPKWNKSRELTTGKLRKLIYAGSIGMGNKDRLDKIIGAVTKYPSLELNIIGITQEQYISTFGELQKESGNIHFFGRIPHLEAVKAVQNSDFQLLIRDSTLKNNAGFPTKFVESISCATPIIATRTSNICDYLKDGVNGFVVSDDKPLESVFERVLKLNNTEIIRMKEECRRLSVFDYRNYKEEFSKLFI